MNFFKKLFNLPIKETKEVQEQKVSLSLDDLFVHNFIKKGGKFIYCTKKEEISNNFKKIISENNWKEIYLLDKTLESIFKNKDISLLKNYNKETPILTSCEHLIADNGNILFSSNQLKSIKISDYPNNFIVYASTSQIVKDTGEGLTGIKTNHQKELPTNISAIKNYTLKSTDDNFLNYGNSNSKNLYLLLLEDL